MEGIRENDIHCRLKSYKLKLLRKSIVQLYAIREIGEKT